MLTIELIQGDCLEKMKDIPDGSVDAIITDPGFMRYSGDGAAMRLHVYLT